MKKRIKSETTNYVRNFSVSYFVENSVAYERAVCRLS